MVKRLFFLALLAGPSCASLHASSNPRPEGCASMEARDILRVLTEYSLVRFPIPPLGDTHLFGRTVYSRREMFVNTGYLEPIQRLTLIHEIQHVRHLEEKRPQDDRLIRACAIAAYIRIFGGDVDLPEPFQQAKLSEWR